MIGNDTLKEIETLCAIVLPLKTKSEQKEKKTIYILKKKTQQISNRKNNGMVNV